MLKSVITVQKSVITMQKSVITVQKSVITVQISVITVQNLLICQSAINMPRLTTIAIDEGTRYLFAKIILDHFRSVLKYKKKFDF